MVAFISGTICDLIVSLLLGPGRRPGAGGRVLKCSCCFFPFTDLATCAVQPSYVTSRGITFTCALFCGLKSRQNVCFCRPERKRRVNRFDASRCQSAERECFYKQPVMRNCLSLRICEYRLANIVFLVRIRNTKPWNRLHMCTVVLWTKIAVEFTFLYSRFSAVIKKNKKNKNKNGRTERDASRTERKCFQ